MVCRGGPNKILLDMRFDGLEMFQKRGLDKKGVEKK